MSEQARIWYQHFRNEYGAATLAAEWMPNGTVRMGIAFCARDAFSRKRGRHIAEGQMRRGREDRSVTFYKDSVAAAVQKALESYLQGPGQFSSEDPCVRRDATLLMMREALCHFSALWPWRTYNGKPEKEKVDFKRFVGTIRFENSPRVRIAVGAGAQR